MFSISWIDLLFHYWWHRQLRVVVMVLICMYTCVVHLGTKKMVSARRRINTLLSMICITKTVLNFFEHI